MKKQEMENQPCTNTADATEARTIYVLLDSITACLYFESTWYKSIILDIKYIFKLKINDSVF